MQLTKTKRQPLVQIVKRTDVSKRFAFTLRIAAVLLALVTGGLFMWALGTNPFTMYSVMINGAVGSTIALRETIKLAIPLCITGLGVTLAFKMRFWNIGAEGQISVGAIAASFFALFYSHLPQPLLLTLMIVAGVIAGGLWGMIPAIFKARFGTNETLLTLMLNYVALYLIQFLREGPWRDPNAMGFPKIAMFEKSARMPSVLGVHAGWIFALALVVLVFVYLRFTKQGYELTVVGENQNTARYAGMKVGKIVVRTMFLSAAICGLAGALQASGADKTLTDTVAGGVGFTAITIAWLSQLNPFAVLLVSSLFAVLEKGSGSMQSLLNISPSAADVFQGIILFFVLGCEFFISYKVIFRKGGAYNG